MQQSILDSTKKVLGLPAEYTAFDEDVLVFINSAISSLYQLGIGPAAGLIVEGADTQWAALEVTDRELAQVKNYIYLKVRMAFDPPTLGFLIDAFNKQILDLEWRLSNFRESTPDTYYETVAEEAEVLP